MLTLLAKDFKLIFARKDSLKKTILSLIFSALAIVAVIAIETYVFSVIMNKMKSYYQAPISFLTLFLFIISVLMMIFGLLHCRKLFFNKADMEQLNAHPVSNGQIIVSKLIFLFILHFFTSLMFTYPLFLSYGMIFYKPKSFYFITFFYPFLSFFFEVGLALFFVYPVKLIADWLKKHLILQFIIAVALIFGFTFLYSKVLSVFISLVASNQLTSIFSSGFIETLTSFKKYMIPTHFLVELLLNGNSTMFMPFMLISIGVFSLGFIVAASSFHYFKNSVSSHANLKKEHKFKIVSVKKALIKKELTLLFKDSGYILSFTGLLVVQPFLAYLVINALNTIFRSGTFAYYLTMLPNFVALIDSLLVMLFTLIIASGASNYISMEGKNVRLMKTIPVSLFTQILIKVGIPFLCSALSLFVTNLTLYLTGVMSITNSLFTFLLTLLLLVIFSIVSLFEEMKVGKNKPRNYFQSSLYSYLLPVVYFVATLIMSYNKVSIVLVYAFGVLAILLISIPYLINIKKKVARLFIDLEMVN